METWGIVLVVGFLLGALAIGLGRSEPPVQVIYVPKVEESQTSSGWLRILALVLLALVTYLILSQAMG